MPVLEAVLADDAFGFDVFGSVFFAGAFLGAAFGCEAALGFVADPPLAAGFLVDLAFEDVAFELVRLRVEAAREVALRPVVEEADLRVVFFLVLVLSDLLATTPPGPDAR